MCGTNHPMGNTSSKCLVHSEKLLEKVYIVTNRYIYFTYNYKNEARLVHVCMGLNQFENRHKQLIDKTTSSPECNLDKKSKRKRWSLILLSGFTLTFKITRLSNELIFFKIDGNAIFKFPAKNTLKSKAQRIHCQLHMYEKN